MILRIEYQLQAIVLLSKDEFNLLMKRINVLVKHRANLSRSTPNVIIYDKDLYGLKHIYDLQIESLCKNLLYEAKLKQFQN